MIRDIEIKQQARKHGVPETTIEKDYALNWILKTLYQEIDSMVLKGGTCLRKVYFENYRFSEDLDFTMLKKIELPELEGLVKKVTRTAKKESGIDFYDDIQSKENTNGYEINIYFRIFRRGGNPLRIKFDITKTENEILILPLEKKQVFHPYSDDCSTSALTYSIQEIVTEKLRSLYERTRARDVYDIWYISKNTNFTHVPGIFKEKCEFKKLTPDINHIITRREYFLSSWNSSLRHQLKEVPEFEPIFKDVLFLLNKYNNMESS